MIRVNAFKWSALLLAVLVAIPAVAADDALSLVPANAASVGMIKLSDMRSSPLSSVLFAHTDKMSADGEAARFLAETGLSPAKDVDVLVVATSPRTALGSEADVLVIAEGRFNAAKLTQALVARGAVAKAGYLTIPDKSEGGDFKGAVAFPSDMLAIAGTESAVAAALEARRTGGTGFRSRGSLGLDLARIDAGVTAWALIDVQRASRLAKAGKINTGSGQSGDALRTALKTLSTIGVWAKDRGDALQLGGFGLSSDGETLELLEDTIRGALSALRLAARDKSPDLVPVLRQFDVSRDAKAVMIEGSIPASLLKELAAKQKQHSHAH